MIPRSGRHRLGGIGGDGDSSAALGIVKRAGVGRVRHLAIAQVWVQERVRNGELRIHKLPGENNPADLLTTYLENATASGHHYRMRVGSEYVRAASAPDLNSLHMHGLSEKVFLVMRVLVKGDCEQFSIVLHAH